MEQYKMARPKRKVPTSMASYRLDNNVLTMIDEMAKAAQTTRTFVLETAVRAQFRRYVKALAQQEQQS